MERMRYDILRTRCSPARSFNDTGGKETKDFLDCFWIKAYCTVSGEAWGDVYRYSFPSYRNDGWRRFEACDVEII